MKVVREVEYGDGVSIRDVRLDIAEVASEEVAEVAQFLVDHIGAYITAAEAVTLAEARVEVGWKLSGDLEE